MILMVTGHRYVEWDQTCRPWVQQNLHAFLRGYLRREEITVLSGMALGADQIFALEALKLGIRVEAAVPFMGQEAKWRPQQVQTYRKILDQCAEIHYVCEPGYAAWKMLERDQFMVDRADSAIAVWDNNSFTGTGKTVDMLFEKAVPTIQLNPRAKTVSVLVSK